MADDKLTARETAQTTFKAACAPLKVACMAYLAARETHDESVTREARASYDAASEVYKAAREAYYAHTAVRSTARFA